MTFDVSAFMNQTVEGPMATFVAPPPEGEFMARIGSEEDDVKVETFQGKKDPSKNYIRCSVNWDIIDEGLKARLERDKIRVRQQFFLDVDPITGMLKTGPEDNVTLGQIREAVNMNTSSGFMLSALRGAGPVMVKISHRADERNPQVKYAEVSRCVKLG